MTKPRIPESAYIKATELLDYDPDSGLFKWKVRHSYQCKKGWFAGSRTARGYLHIGVQGVRLKSHRIAWYAWCGEVPDYLDHINGDRDDNRIANLRSCTNAENMRNLVTLQRNNTSGTTGVCWFKPAGLWTAQIKVDGTNLNLGYYRDKEDAIKARKVAELRYFGEFAPTTPPASPTS